MVETSAEKLKRKRFKTYEFQEGYLTLYDIPDPKEAENIYSAVIAPPPDNKPSIGSRGVYFVETEDGESYVLKPKPRMSFSLRTLTMRFYRALKIHKEKLLDIPFLRKFESAIMTAIKRYDSYRLESSALHEIAINLEAQRRYQAAFSEQLDIEQPIGFYVSKNGYKVAIFKQIKGEILEHNGTEPDFLRWRQKIYSRLSEVGISADDLQFVALKQSDGI